MKQNVQTMDFKDPAAHSPAEVRSSVASSPPSASPSAHPGWAVSTQFALPQPGGDAPSGAAASPTSASSPLDICHVGVVLRVVLGVQLVVGLAQSFQALGPADALTRWAQSAVVTLPASLLWLVVACSASRWLSRQRDAWQWGAAMGLGAAVGALAQWQLTWLDLWTSAPRGAWGWTWVPPMLTGAALAGVGLAWLKHRAHSQLPAHAAARLAELQARIRPHFLFNSLNAVLGLIRRDPKRAEQTLEDLSDLFRALMSDGRSLVRLADEIALIERYAAIEQLRLGERLRMSWELDNAPVDAMLPPLVLQPLVENAIYHGVEPGTGTGDVLVRIERRGDRVLAAIENPWHAAGAGGRAGNHMALDNIRERLMLFFDDEARLESRVDGARYRVEIEIPYRSRA